MAKAKSEKYIVTNKHCLGHKIGAEIDLTEDKARALVGKVRLKDEVEGENKLAEAAGKAQERVNQLEAEVADLKNDVTRLTSELAQAEKKAK